MPRTAQTYATAHQTLPTGVVLGIWRLMECCHQGEWSLLYKAQPAAAQGCPRLDYLVKTAKLDKGFPDLESQRQLKNQVLVSTSAHDPHLVPVLDFSMDGSSPFLVMPLLPGKTLQGWMDAGKWQPLPVALWWMRQCAQGLAALHAAGWVHGDLKPENIMVSVSGHATLIDFGFAYPAAQGRARVGFQGTPDYAAPESILEGVPCGTPSDMYSLGIMLWQVTRQSPVSTGASVVIGELVDSDDPVDQLVWSLTSSDPAVRPTAKATVDRLLRLEIELLGRYIRPTPTNHRRAA